MPADLFTVLRKLRAALDSDLSGQWTEHVADLAQMADEAIEHAQRDPSAAARNAARAAGVWAASAPLREAGRLLREMVDDVYDEEGRGDAWYEEADSVIRAWDEAAR